MISKSLFKFTEILLVESLILMCMKMLLRLKWQDLPSLQLRKNGFLMPGSLKFWKNDDWYQYEIINVCMFLLTVESVLKTENELYLKNYFQSTILFQLQFTCSICYVGISFHRDWLAHCNLISSFVVLPNSHDICTRTRTCTVSLFCECF